MDKEPITLNGLNKIKDELIFLKEKKKKKTKRKGLIKKKKINILREEDIQNLTYYMIEEQNLD